jgi:class 3 adenylate cyclase/tetratricopeptide (TPR) repeat protein
MVVASDSVGVRAGDAPPASGEVGDARPASTPDPAHLARYLPPLLAEWDHDAEARHRVVEGTVAFVDISGFTKLSEKLAQHGKIGAEALTDTIDQRFVELLGIAFANGGQLIKFGGDALLLLFTGDDQALRACRAAADMRRALRAVGRQWVLEHPVMLRMSVGVHSGNFDFFLVGASHRELIVTGPAATTTVMMEATAEAGEIVVSDATAALLPPSMLGARKGDGTLLRRVPTSSGGGPTASLWMGPSRTVDLATYLPVAVRRALSAGIRLSEHRRAAVAFVHFDGTDGLLGTRDPADAAVVLEELVAGVQEAADRNDVAFLSSDIDRDGGKIILTSGVPLATEDAEDRMLRAVREIVDVIAGPVSVRIGVHRAPLFVGEIGPPERRSFTVMGDGVNLAARVMAKAQPGQILCTADFLERTRLSVEAEALEPFTVKGKAKPVTAFSIGAIGEKRTPMAFTAAPFVGRRDEFDLLRAAMDRARGGERAVVEVTGEPGVGKTRFVSELLAEAEGFQPIEVVCEPYDSATPFRAARTFLLHVLGIDAHADQAVAVRQLREVVRAVDPELLPRLPLLGVVLGLPVPETPETAQLEDRFRRPLMASTIADLVGGLLVLPTLLVFEDAHFMDDVSAELLASLATGAGPLPWLIVIARREIEGGLRAPDPSALRLRLGALGESESLELVDLLTADAPLPRHVGVALAERSGGNPLFLIGLAVAAGSGVDVEELPDSVEAVVTARIDQLATRDRYLLRRASVLGRRFPARLLDAVLDEPLDDEVPHRLSRFLQWEDDGTVRFTHALLRESSYDGLPYRLRRELHARAGEAILSHSAENPEEQAGLLALHFLHAQRYVEAHRFALVAAQRATENFADVESVGFYEHALGAARHLADLEPTEHATLHESLADARYRVGLYGPAESAYRQARRLRGGDPVAEARVLLKLGRLQGWLDCYQRALRWIARALKALEGVPGEDAARQRAQVLAWYGRFCQEEGRHKRALLWCERAVAEATLVDEKEALANALKVTDWARMDLGLLQDPADWHQALRLFEELGDSPSVASMLNFLGGFAYWRGEWTQALDMYRQAQETVKRTGNSVMDAFCRNNIAEIALDQGRLDESERLFHEALHIWRAAEYRSVIASATCNLARLAAARGDFDEALRQFEEAASQADHVGGQSEMLEIRTRTAECLLLMGDGDAALAMAEGCLEQIRALGGVPPQKPLLERIRGVVLFTRGVVDDARAALEESLGAAQARHATYEIALTLRVLDDLGQGVDDRGAGELRREGEAIFAELGVEWVPAMVPASSRP